MIKHQKHVPKPTPHQLSGRHGASRLPDAMSLATALVSNARLLTLDRELQRIADRERDG